VAFLEKPPLYYWSCSLVYAVSGRVTAGLTRLPAALYGFLGALFVFLIGKRFFNARVGFVAAAILATSIQYFKMSHFALMDSSLAALITGSFYFYLIGQNFLFILALILAFYTKGFVAVALAGVVIGTDLLLQKKIKKCVWLSLAGFALLLLALLPWVIGLWRSGGENFLRIFFIDNNWKRFVSSGADHHSPFYLYFGSFLGDFLPWTLFFIGGLIGFLKREKWRDLPPVHRFFWIWFGAMFLFLSASSSKRSMYLMPAFPAAALLSALWVEKIFQSMDVPKMDRIFFVGTAVLAILAGGFVFGFHAVRHKAFVAPLVGGVALTALGWFYWAALKKRQHWHAFLAVLFIFMGSLVSANRFFIRDLEADKSFVPFCDTVKSRLGNGTLIAYDLSEMERGVFSFYFERLIPNALNLNQLGADLMANQKTNVLLIASRNKDAELIPFLEDQMDLIYSFRENQKTRAYRLFSNRTSHE
jgi:4-amino-4-deoxy-L-arabinose transferase-like glycosyltransferase